MKQMKLIMVLLVTLLVCSCSSDGQYSPISEVSGEDVALQELMAKEDSLCDVFNLGTETRADNTKLSFWQWCKVVFADAKGYITGGGKTSERVVTAVFSSVAKYIEIIEKKRDKADDVVNSVKKVAPYNNAPSIDDSNESLTFINLADIDVFNNDSHIGIQHNSTILALFDKYPKASDWNDIDNTVIVNRVVSQMREEGYLGIGETINKDNVISLVKYTNYDYSEDLNMLIPTGRTNNVESDKFDSLICQFLMGIVNIKDDSKKKAFASEYLNNIDISNLMPQSKNELKFALNIAMASSVLWNIDYFNGLEN